MEDNNSDLSRENEDADCKLKHLEQEIGRVDIDGGILQSQFRKQKGNCSKGIIDEEDMFLKKEKTLNR